MVSENQPTDTVYGLNLHIDESVQKLCEASNASSSMTRRILYIMVIVGVLSFISVLNTNMWNWTQARINYYTSKLGKLKGQANTTGNLTEKDSIEALICIYKEKQNSHIKNYSENISNVHIPIAGNEFDVNNLGIISGLTFIIILIILRFTINREIDNLKIALKAITERYQSNSDFIQFELYLKNDYNGEYLSQINKSRRKFHYDFLWMNEVFNLPNNNSMSALYRVQKNILYFPLIVYLFVLANDVSTIEKGLGMNKSLTIICLIFDIGFLILVTILTVRGTQQKAYFSSLYSSFRNNEYKNV